MRTMVKQVPKENVEDVGGTIKGGKCKWSLDFPTIRLTRVMAGTAGLFILQQRVHYLIAICDSSSSFLQF